MSSKSNSDRTIKFYKNSDCNSDNKIGTICLGNSCSAYNHSLSYDKGKYWNLTDSNTSIMANDEAKAVKLDNVPSGTTIKVYDNSDGHKDDDWAKITVKQTTDQTIKITSFEDNYEDENYQIEYHKNNGLDGKVSLIEVNCGSQP